MPEEVKPPALIRVTKLQAVQRQLESAIELYFKWGDPIVIHTLAAASNNVLRDLYRSQGRKHPLLVCELIDEFVRPEHQRLWNDRFRDAENFFKHADRDPDAILHFDPAISELWLFGAVEAWSVMTNQYVKLLHLFRAWWLLMNREILVSLPRASEIDLFAVSYRPDQRTDFFIDMSKLTRD